MFSFWGSNALGEWLKNIGSMIMGYLFYFIDFFFIQSELSKNYFFLNLFDLFLESLILLFSWLVLLSEFFSIHISSTSQHAFQVVNCISGFFRFFIKLNQNFSQLVDCSCAFQILFEFFFLALDASLALIDKLPLTFLFLNMSLKKLYIFSMLKSSDLMLQ